MCLFKGEYSTRILGMNFSTDSRALQANIESSLDKKSGRQYGPVGRKQLILFIDDLYASQQTPKHLNYAYDGIFW